MFLFCFLITYHKLIQILLAYFFKEEVEPYYSSFPFIVESWIIKRLPSNARIKDSWKKGRATIFDLCRLRTELKTDTGPNRWR